MNSLTKRLMAGMAAAATLLAGLTLAGPAMADGDETEAQQETTAGTVVGEQQLATTTTLTVTAPEGTDLSTKTLYALRLSAYTSATYENVTVTNTDKTTESKNLVYTYDVDTKNTPEGLQTAVRTAINDTFFSTGDATKNKLPDTDNNPMQWVVNHLWDSRKSPYTGKLRNFIKALEKADVLTGTDKGINATDLTDKDHGFVKLSAVTGATNKAQATVPQGIYIIFEKPSEEAPNAPISLVMMTGTKIAGMDFNEGTKDKPLPLTLGEVEYKPNLPTVDKKIIERTDKTDTQGTELEENHASIGDQIEYRLTTKVPDWSGYDSYYLAMEDDLSAGLTPVYKPVTGADGKTTQVLGATIRIERPAKNEDGTYQFDANGDPIYTAVRDDQDATSTQGGLLKSGTDYQITMTTPAPEHNDGSHHFRFLFAPTKDDKGNTDSDIIEKTTGQDGKTTVNTDQKFAIGSRITVTYYATLNKNAVIGTVAGNPNSVHLEYSNNPSTNSHGKSEDHTVKTYTGSFSLHKVDAKGEDLKGAKFQVCKGDSTTCEDKKFTPMEFAYDATDKVYKPWTGETTANGNEPSKITDIDLTNIASTRIDGVAGTYTVRETVSPYKNVKYNENLTFTVEVKMETNAKGEYTGNYTVSVLGGSNTEGNNGLVTKEGTQTARVTNVTSLLDMPKTGQAWMRIYAIAALALLACGTVLILTGRKTAAHKGRRS